MSPFNVLRKRLQSRSSETFTLTLSTINNLSQSFSKQNKTVMAPFNDMKTFTIRLSACKKTFNWISKWYTITLTYETVNETDWYQISFNDSWRIMNSMTWILAPENFRWEFHLSQNAKKYSVTLWKWFGRFLSSCTLEKSGYMTFRDVDEVFKKSIRAVKTFIRSSETPQNAFKPTSPQIPFTKGGRPSENVYN